MCGTYCDSDGKSMIQIFIQGFLLQASLILALGAQNIFVLNSGLRRERHLLVALVSSICDALLVFVGVLGVATVFIEVPILKIGLGVIGVAFLFIYGLLKLRDAWVGVKLSPDSVHALIKVRQIIFTSLAFSLLNPHVYLDTVVLIGGYSTQFSQFSERFCFGLGASTFSTIWFFGLVTLASLGRRLLLNEKSMRLISFISGLVLIVLALRLGVDLMHWFHASTLI